MKAAVLLIGVVVLLAAGWKLVGVGGDNLASKIKQTLNEHPLLHFKHPVGVVESVECEDDAAIKVPPHDDSFYNCVVRYDDGALEPWCAATGVSAAPGGFTAFPEHCSSMDDPGQ